MVKAAAVRPVFFRTVCPGKFLAAVSGDVAAVDASVLAARAVAPETLADWFVIPNVHPEVVEALSGCVAPRERGALGVMETFSAASAVLAADRAVKTAHVQLLDVRTALGLGGKGYVLLTGDVGAVQAAVDAGAESARSGGLLVGCTVLPHPAYALFEQLI
jgi:microcompartment protein CcmL/EutN